MGTSQQDESGSENTREDLDNFDAQVSELDSLPPRGIHGLWTANPLASVRFTRRQRLWRAGSAAGAVALVCLLLFAGTYAGIVRHLFEAPPPQPVTLPAARDGLVCITDIAWSPDSRRIAVAGYANNGCGAETYATPLILVYDARSDRLVQRILPGPAVLSALHALLPNLPLPGVSQNGALDLLLYENFLLWSPNGDRLGLVFLAVAYPQTGWTSITGLFVANADGSQPSAHLRLLDPATPVTPQEWDVHSGTTLVGKDYTGPYHAVPPALAYTWGALGDLAPQEPLVENIAPSAPLSGPIGSPARNTRFTVWQPGALISVAQWDGAHYSAGYEWNTRFAAWSPDGRYVINLIHVLASLSLTGEGLSGSQVPASSQGAQAVLPVRDVALTELMLAAPPQSTAGEWEVAWRPDGRELAAFRLSNEPAHSVGIYDCASGRLLLSLPLASTTGSTFIAGSTALVRWSPDGSRLLLFSPQLGAITVAGPKDLRT